MRRDRLVSEVLGQEVALSPSDLLNADLKTVIIGGYDKAEVDALLDRTADALERSMNEARRLRQQTDELREQLQQYQEMETTLRNALISSQKISETLVGSARAQADALVEEARLAKARARFQMEELPAALRGEIRTLKAERDRLRADLTAVLKTHESLLAGLPRAEEGEDGGGQTVERSHFVSFDEDHSPAPEPRRAAVPPPASASHAVDFGDEDDGEE